MIFSVPALGGPKVAPNYPYKLEQSLRLRSPNANASLSRTYAANPVDRTKITLSMWVKRGRLLAGGGSDQQILFAGYDGSSTYSGNIYFTAGEQFAIGFGGGAVNAWISTKTIVDSEWHHYHVIIDTTQATAANRIKVWIDGVLEAPSTFAEPGLNALHQFCLGNANNRIGVTYDATQQWFDGYVEEFRVFDGYAVPVTETGRFYDPLGGIWVPKIPAWNFYGANGFWLPYRRNNLLLESEALNTATWVRGATTSAYPGYPAPNGTLTACLVEFLNNTDAIYQDVVVSAPRNRPFTFSGYINANTGSDIVNMTLWWLDPAGGPFNISMSVDVTNGNTGGPVASNPAITVLGYKVGPVDSLGYRRVSMSGSCNLFTTTMRPTFYPTVAAPGQSAWIWGAQLEWNVTDAQEYQYVGSSATLPLGDDWLGRRNQVLNSQAYNLWTPNGSVTVTPNTTAAPDGTLTATTLTGTNFGAVLSDATGTLQQNERVTISLYVKKDPAATTFPLWRITSRGDLIDVLVKLGTGEVFAQYITSTPGSGAVEDYGSEDAGDYWRIWATGYFATAPATWQVQIYPAIGFLTGWPFYDTGANASIVAWGAQVEYGNVLHAYVPTQSARVTVQNYWTPANVSLAVNSMNYDAVYDNPTNNYATLNPNQGAAQSGATVLRDGNLIAYTATSGTGGVRSTKLLPRTGKWFWSSQKNGGSENAAGFNLTSDSTNYCLGASGVGYYSTNGGIFKLATQVATGAAWTAANDTIGIAIDCDAGKAWFSKGDVWQNGDPVAGTGGVTGINFAQDWVASVCDGSSTASANQVINFGQIPFYGGVYPPAGFKEISWQTTNELPPPVYPEAVFANGNVDITGTKLTLNFTQAVTGSITAGTLQYRINGGASINVPSPVVSGASVTATLSPAVQQGQTLEILLSGNTTLKTVQTGNPVADVPWTALTNNALPLLARGFLTVGNVNNLFWGLISQYAGTGYGGSYSPVSGLGLFNFSYDYTGLTWLQSADGSPFNGPTGNIRVSVGGTPAGGFVLSPTLVSGGEDPDFYKYQVSGDYFNFSGRSGQYLEVQILAA